MPEGKSRAHVCGIIVSTKKVSSSIIMEPHIQIIDSCVVKCIVVFHCCVIAGEDPVAVADGRLSLLQALKEGQFLLLSHVGYFFPYHQVSFCTVIPLPSWTTLTTVKSIIVAITCAHSVIENTRPVVSVVIRFW